MRKTVYIILLFSAVFTACRKFPDLFADEQLLAEANGKSLYLYDIESIFTPGITAEDSVKLLQSYVDQWVKRQLKEEEAEKMLEEDGAEDIDKMVEDYRSSLLINRLDRYYVDSRIDTVFTEQQLSDYYERHKSEFVLSKPIVKARVVKVPDNYRQMASFREMMASSKSSAYQEFVDICIKNGFEMMEIGSWSDFSELLQLIPTEKGKDYGNMLSEDKLFEFPAGSGYRYLVKITDKRLKGDYQPLESVRAMIQRVIFNERRQDIIHGYEDSLYSAAVADKKIKIQKN